MKRQTNRAGGIWGKGWRPAAFGLLVTAASAAAIAAVAAFGTDARSAATPSCIKPDGAEVRVRGGTFLMGSEEFYDEEGPVRTVAVADFWIDRHDVTNRQFAEFVAATGYVTDAEKSPDPKDYPEVPAETLAAGGAVFMPLGGRPSPADLMSWWRFVSGADWRHPDGPGSNIQGREDFPVVQVSYNDALAYARWRGRDLPTEAQYEYAARGGLDGKRYAWGDGPEPEGGRYANTWEGEFPVANNGGDGFAGTAPVGCFQPNGYGLHDVVGNVWKWTRSTYEDGPPPGIPAARILRVIKGGSFLCAPNFCRRYRPAARQSQETGFSSVHLGFRTVRNTDG